MNVDNCAFAYLLINILDLSNIILTCLEYILDCLWLYLANNEDAKIITKNTYILATSILSIYTRNIYIGSIYTLNA